MYVTVHMQWRTQGEKWGSRGFNCEESMSAERERLAAHISEANVHFWSCRVPEAKSKHELKTWS